MLDALALVLFVVWLGASLLVNVPRLTPLIRGLDVLALVPEWKFFAPNPGRADYHLLFRDQFPDGTLTDWTEIALITPRSWWMIAWNPEKRGKKALFDVVSELAAYARDADLQIELSIPYLTILNFVSLLARSAAPSYTQFVIMYAESGSGATEPHLLFLSGMHAL
jgi:hypothetical protein